MKKFSYKVDCLNLEKSIEVNTKKIPTVGDLKNEISKELYVDNMKIQINADLNTKLKDLPDQHKFTVSIKIDHKDMSFIFPNKAMFTIDNCYAKDVFDVNEFFQHEHIFFSKSCITKNQRFEISDKYLPDKAQYPFLSPTNNTAYVRLIGDTVCIKYGFWTFFLSEKEQSDVLYKFLHNKYGDKTAIYIYEKNKKLQKNDKLKKSKDYKIIIERTFSFQCNNFFGFLYPSFNVNLDLLTTVYEAQKKIALFNGENPKDITLYNSDKQEIKDSNLKLIQVQNSNKLFYYSISLFFKKKSQAKPHQHPQHQPKKQIKNTDHDRWNITFYVKCKNKANINQETLIVCNKMKIKKIKKILKNRYSIDSKIQIKLKNEKVVDNKKKIIDIAKELRNDGKNELFIYEKQKQKIKKPSKQEIEDKSNEDDDNNNDAQISKSYNDKKAKQKPKLKKPSKQEIEDKSDEDDDNDVQTSKSYNEKLSKRKSKHDEDDDNNDDVQTSKSFNEKLSNRRSKHDKDDDNNDDVQTSKSFKPTKKLVKKPVKKQQGSTPMIKYIYQTNMDPEDKEIEMEEDATVKDMKEKIGEEMEINNIYDIKIIFAGKELLNEIVLKDLNIGDIKLFVYIRTQEDILLMTAKALQISEYSSSSSNSEEEDNDDDDFYINNIEEEEEENDS